MKHHFLSKRKKGAIEMSMQTIIVVVIGITLLTLGLKFVYDTFLGISANRQAVDDATAKQLRELFGESDDPLNFNANSIGIEQGEETSIALMIKNVGATKAAFSYAVEYASGPVKGQLSWLPEGFDLNELDVGESKDDLMVVSVPDDAIPGTYKFRIKLACGSGDCKNGFSKTLLIKVI